VDPSGRCASGRRSFLEGFRLLRFGGQEEVLTQAGAARLGGEVAPLVARPSLSVETDSGRCS
jgi:hypothetical protein